MSRSKAPVLDLSHQGDRTFLHLLLNVLIVSVMNFTVWFAITFWMFIETQSVLATGMVAGIFLVCTAASGIWFGSLVDHHRKKLVMQGSVVASLAFYAVAFACYQLGSGGRLHPGVQRLAVGVRRARDVRGDRRQRPRHRDDDHGHLLIEPERRDRANGLVGTTTGVTMLATSVISGLLVARDGMFSVLLLTMALLVAGLIHLSVITVDESRAAELELRGRRRRSAAEPPSHKVDLKGTIRQVRQVPGLLALIASPA